MNNIKRRYVTGLLCLGLIFGASCSKESVNPTENGAKPVYDPSFKTFEEVKEVALDGIDQSKLTARAVRVKGDTLFVANNHSEDRAIYLFSIKENRQIGKISSWVRDEVQESFNAEIGDMAVSGKYIFVGMHNSRVNIFERKTLKFVNAIGRSDGGWGAGIYDMVHCFGVRECGDKLIVRDKESIRAYLIYEAVTEPAFRVPWLGKIVVPEGVGYDYSAKHHGMVEYDGKIYLDDFYQKAIQVFTPSKMVAKEFETSDIKRDTVYSTGNVAPAGLTASGGSVFYSVSGTGKINRFDLKSGTLQVAIADFSNRQVGRMELVGDDLYFIDIKTGKIVLAKGVKEEISPSRL